MQMMQPSALDPGQEAKSVTSQPRISRQAKENSEVRQLAVQSFLQLMLKFGRNIWCTGDKQQGWRSCHKVKKRLHAAASFMDAELTIIKSGSKCRKGINIVVEDGVLEDIIVTSVSRSSVTHHEEKTCEVNTFFNDAQLVTLGNSSTKLYHFCKSCP
jgi:hypothetical protein